MTLVRSHGHLWAYICQGVKSAWILLKIRIHHCWLSNTSIICPLLVFPSWQNFIWSKKIVRYSILILTRQGVRTPAVKFSPVSFQICGHGVNNLTAAAAAKLLQSCPTLCDPIDSSPPGSPVPGILQARTLEWVAVSFSNAWKWKVKAKSLSRIRLLATPWTAAYQAPPSMGFSRQEYWSRVPLPSPNLRPLLCKMWG